MRDVGYIAGNVAVILGLLTLVLTIIRLWRRELTWSEYILGMSLGTFCAIMGLIKMGAL